MTQMPLPNISLSESTKRAIATALGNPGSNNANFKAAYDAIYRDLQASDVTNPGSVDRGTLNWFSQAGLVNSFQFSPNAAGAFIYAYTQAAGQAFGVNITYQQLQAASNRIALSVFQTLTDSRYIFDSVIALVQQAL